MLSAGSNSVNPIARLVDDCTANGSQMVTQTDEKRIQSRYFFKSLNESIRTSEEETESVTSNQNYETELVQDTPDTETKSECYSSDNELEYEVASNSEDESNPIIDNDSSGSNDILTTAGVIAAVICDTSREAWLTDGEDSDNSSMDETIIKRKDFWTCVQCKSQNNNPSFRFCQKCFQVRKNCFPPRPRGQKKKRTNKVPLNQSPAVHSHDSGLGSSQDLALELIAGNGSKEEVTNTVNIEGRKRKCSTSVNEEETKSKKTKVDEPQELFLKCVICNEQKRDSIFLHGKIGHMYCCYKCAKRCWNTTKKCPTCNRKIQQVVKVYS